MKGDYRGFLVMNKDVKIHVLRTKIITRFGGISDLQGFLFGVVPLYILYSALFCTV